VVAYIDDNPRKTEKEVDRIRIYPFNELDNLFRLYGVDEIIISSFSIPARRRAQLVEVCLEKISHYSAYRHLISGLTGSLLKSSCRLSRLSRC